MNSAGGDTLADVVARLTLDEVEPDVFEAAPNENGLGRLYGGQVAAHALAAAERTVASDRPAHSCHGYFIRPGDPAMPVRYHVVRDRDGRSFSARRVTAVQHGEPIFAMGVSCHVREPGRTHQQPMPDAPPPESLPHQYDLLSAEGARVEFANPHVVGLNLAVDYRAVDPVGSFSYAPRSAKRRFWLRANGALPDDERLHRLVLTWASDLNLMHTGLLPFGIGWSDPRLQTASLDHALWFHAPFRVDDWLLCAMESPVAGGALTLARADLFTSEGTLVASMAQQGLIRIVE